MNKQKKVWEKLAQKNYRYYINSDFGKKITDKQFRDSGFEAYKKLILDDGLIWSRKTILDLGCGAGRLTEFMAQDFKKVIGVDIAPTMIAQAKQRLGKLKNTVFLETDGKSIPLPSNSVDVAFSYLVFQHIKDGTMAFNLLTDIFRVLKHGGIFKVLLRSDRQFDMEAWWTGVDITKDQAETITNEIGFKTVKTADVDENSYWLWLQKAGWLTCCY